MLQPHWPEVINADFFDAATLLAAWNVLPESQRVAAEQQLWEQLKHKELPLRCADSGAATFIWHQTDAPAITHVHLTLNRITDKQYTHHGLLENLAGSKIWVATFELGKEYISSYGFQELTEAPQPRRSPIGHETYPWLRDPLNPAVLIDADATHGLSIIDSPYSGCTPALQSFYARDQYPTQTHRWNFELSGAPFEISLCSATSDPAILLVCPDGEKWQEQFHFAATLEAYRCKYPTHLPGVAVACIHNPDGKHRMDLLRGDSPFPAEFPRLITHLREVFQDNYGSLPEFTVFAGQSLGGLSALRLALTEATHTHLDAIIAQSPSMWWKPGGSRPERHHMMTTWISQQFRHTTPTAPQLFLQVGLREDMLLEHTLRLGIQLQQLGWPVRTAAYDGGHDPAWWMAGAIKALEELSS